MYIPTLCLSIPVTTVPRTNCQHHVPSDRCNHPGRHQPPMRFVRPGLIDNQPGRELSVISGSSGRSSIGLTDGHGDNDQRHQDTNNHHCHSKHHEVDDSIYGDQEWSSSKRPTPPTEFFNIGTPRPGKPIGSGTAWSMRELRDVRSTKLVHRGVRKAVVAPSLRPTPSVPIGSSPSRRIQKEAVRFENSISASSTSGHSQESDKTIVPRDVETHPGSWGFTTTNYCSEREICSCGEA